MPQLKLEPSFLESLKVNDSIRVNWGKNVTIVRILWT